MLRRGSSKSSNRLSRRKSTSSVVGNPESIDPEFARQQAQAAASYAFVRARERESADLLRSNVLRKNGNFVSYQPTHSASDSANPADHMDQILERKQSVRFAGPNAVTRVQSVGTRAIRATANSKTSSAIHRPRALTTDVPVPAAYRPPSRSSSIGRTSTGYGKAESSVTAVAVYDEYYTREDDVASTPSSYKRIRKSKSFLSPINKLPGIFFSSGTPENSFTATGRSRSRTSGMDINTPTLREPRSMSFLQLGRGRKNYTQRQDPDAAVQAARDEFLHQIEQQRLREQPSFIFRSRAKREEKPFRRSVRSSSTTSHGQPVASKNQSNTPKEPKTRTRARKVSEAIKKKLKGFFRRDSEDPEQICIPQQQIEAQRSHDIEYVGGAQRESALFLDIPPLPESTKIFRVASSIPYLHAVPSKDGLKSRTGSLQSLRSDQSSNSRVTSWNSTAADNTLNSRFAQAERERQRLSIIQENGTHVSSSSFSRSRTPAQFIAGPQSIQRSRSCHSHPNRLGQVDSQKVYMALMKRLDENSPKAKLAQRMASSESLCQPNYIPPRTSSIRSGSCETPATIRQVFEDAMETLVPSMSAQSDEDDVFLIKKTDKISSTKDSPSRPQSASGESTTAYRKPSYSAYPRPAMGDIECQTPQQTAMRNEAAMPKSKILRESRSGFFGQSSFTTLSRTTSPYRRALAQSVYNPGTITGEFATGKSSPRPAVELSAPTYNPSDQDISGQQASNPVYTESTYSRTTSGRTPKAAGSAGSPILAVDDTPLHTHGSLVVVDRTTYRPTVSNHQATSSADCVEWKQWMAAQVSNIERTKENERATKVDYALPTMPKAFGHVRENAQIEDDDIEVTEWRTNATKQPLGIVQLNVQLKPILKYKMSSSHLEIPVSQRPLPPQRSPLRPTQSQTSLRLTETGVAERVTSAPPSILKSTSTAEPYLHHTRSNTTLRSLDSPARLIKKKARAPPIPSPGITAAVEKQFGPAMYRLPYSGTENSGPAPDILYGTEGTGLMGSRLDPQVLGSKRMVENFLSSRRRRVAGSDESNAFI